MPRMPSDYAPGAMAPHDQAVVRHFRRNVAAAVTTDALWGVGLPFALSSVLIPAYLNFLASPKVLVGIVSSLVMILTGLLQNGR